MKASWQGGKWRKAGRVRGVVTQTRTLEEQEEAREGERDREDGKKSHGSQAKVQGRKRGEEDLQKKKGRQRRKTVKQY